MMERLRRKSPTVSEGSQLMEALKKTRGSRYGVLAEGGGGQRVRDEKGARDRADASEHRDGRGDALEVRGERHGAREARAGDADEAECAVREKARGRGTDASNDAARVGSRRRRRRSTGDSTHDGGVRDGGARAKANARAGRTTTRVHAQRVRA